MTHCVAYRGPASLSAWLTVGTQYTVRAQRTGEGTITRIIIIICSHHRPQWFQAQMTSCMVKALENRPLLRTSEVRAMVQPGPSPKELQV